LICGKLKISSFSRFGVNLEILEFNLHFSLGFESFGASKMIPKLQVAFGLIFGKVSKTLVFRLLSKL
jgi:hypothetical protein